jgi:putative ABC transport system permease protein
VVIGLATALALTRALASILEGLSSPDATLIGMAIALVTLAAALACYIPARRATRVDPMAALRT